jgi:hypothetical protein
MSKAHVQVPSQKKRNGPFDPFREVLFYPGDWTRKGAGPDVLVAMKRC